MVTAYLFDERRGEEPESWLESLERLSENQVLWLDLHDPSDEELREVGGALEIDARVLRAPERSEPKPRLEQHERYLRVTAVAVSDAERDPRRETVVVDCFVGANWVLTSRSSAIAALDDFRELTAGEGALGALDAPSFLSTLLEWVVASYLRAFEEVEQTLEEFDVDALRSPSDDPDAQIAMLVEARRRVGHLRRALAPHREVFAALSHSEFAPLSSDESAERFAELTASVENALASAREAKDGIASSFDVLIVRTEHRTNEVMKVLTLASILLLPGALMAGVAGMNVNFNAHTFTHSPLFWIVVASIVVIALATLSVARLRRWI